MIIECPNKTYKKLNESGIVKKILDKRKNIDDLLLTAYLPLGDLMDLFETSESSLIHTNLNNKITEKEKLHQDIYKLKVFLENEDNRFYDKEQVLMDNPSLLGFLVLGEDLLNYKNYGFFDRLDLEKAITSFCIGERQFISDYMRGDYFWRNNKFKNWLSNSSHGDLLALQFDVSENSNNNLFGFEINEGFKMNPPKERIGAHYDNWSSFLMSTLEYAKALGKEKMKEIVNWKEVLNKIGAVGTATAEAEFGTDHDLTLTFLANSFLMGTNSKKDHPSLLNIYAGENLYFFPYFLDGQLIYLRKDKEGKIESPFKKGIYSNLRFNPTLVYEETDLPYLLEGTYSLFARDRSILPEIMDLFIKIN